MFKWISHSFAAKLSFYIISTFIVLSVIAFQFFRQLASKSIEENAYQEVRDIAEKTDLQIQVLLKSVEKIPNTLQWLLNSYSLPADSIAQITRRIVENNTEIYGCAVAFEPGYILNGSKNFAIYSHMEGDSTVTTPLDIEKYNYPQSNWYRSTKQSGQSNWTIPFKNKTETDTLLSSYSVPLFGSKQEFIGVFSIDLATGWMQNLVNNIITYENSYIFIIDKNGQYVISHQDNPQYGQNIFHIAEQMQDTTAIWIAKQMVQGKQGKVFLNDNGIKSYVFYAPLSSVDWYMGIVCPYDSIFKQLNRFNRIVISLFVFVMFLIFWLNVRIIKRLSLPLKQLAIYARTIAKGQFATPLPSVKSKDEMRELYESFYYMQQELALYLDDLRQTTAEKEKIESELRIAHEIQMGMVPKVFPPFPERKELDLYAVLKPARQVGGDLYDFFINGNDLYFAIGDVSGKGVPASLMMAVTISLLRSFSSKRTCPACIVNSLNDSIIDRNKSDVFVTFFIGMLNLETGELKYCNAGHMPPIMTAPNRTISFFDIKSDIPLGIIKGYEYSEYSYTLAPGSGILLYTDGVTDAENEQQQFYTKERLLRAVKNNSSFTPKEFIGNILSDIESYTGNAEQADDLTMLTVVYGTEWNIDKK